MSASPSPHQEVAGFTRAICRGEESGFRCFYEAYKGRLFAYLLVIHRGHEDAAREAMQETLRRVVRHLRPFDREDAFWSWLTVVARSASHAGSRKRLRYLGLLDRFRKQVPPPEASPLQEGEDPSEILQACLQALDTDERRLLEAKYFETRSVAELATDYGLSQKSIESRLTRARAHLRTAMLNYQPKD